MKPAVKGAVAAAMLAALAGLGQRFSPLPTRTVVRHVSSSDGDWSPCPPGSIPDRETCVPVPGPNDSLVVGSEPSPPPGMMRHERQGIPLRPDRPLSYSSFRLPVALGTSVDALIRSVPAPGHETDSVWGIELRASPGTKVRTPILQNQVGEAEVVYAGQLVGPSLVTLHTVREGAEAKRYVVVLGHVNTSKDLVGKKLGERQVVGEVEQGASGLFLQTAMVREEAPAADIRSARVLDAGVTIPCDPRNVLAERGK